MAETNEGGGGGGGGEGAERRLTTPPLTKQQYPVVGAAQVKSVKGPVIDPPISCVSSVCYHFHIKLNVISSKVLSSVGRGAGVG